MEREQRYTSSRAVYMWIMPIVAAVLIDVFFLAMLDTLFVNKKRAMIISDHFRFQELLSVITPMQNELLRIFEHPQRQTTRTSPGPLLDPIAQIKANAKEYIEKNAAQYLEGDHPWYSLILTDDQNEVIAAYQIPEKIHQFNDWSNCLFTRSFHAPAVKTYLITIGSSRKLNLKFTAYYATPRDWPSIKNLVWWHWVYALLFIFATWIVYGLLNRYIFNALHRVGRAIEGMIHSERVSLIPQPRQMLEIAFNQLARNQREIYFSLEVERIVNSLHALSDDTEVLRRFATQIITSVQRIYQYESVSVYLFNRGIGQFEAAAHSGPSTVPPALPNPNGEPVELLDDGFSVIRIFTGNQIVAALQCRLNPHEETGHGEPLEMAQEISKQIENGLARAFSRSRTLTEERNRFGINLAVNMGHDLTNIIASGKWDLDTIQRSRDLGIVSMNPEKAHFFIDAVNGLGNNLRFLQEMVNIYRSFGYTRRPRYERVQLADLARNVTELFRRSISKTLTIEMTLDETIEINAEPRLLRMALFNLLANAAQALQRHAAPDRKGSIHVILVNNNEDSVLLSVRDNGPGIRGADGSLLQEPEINRIFQAGFSTKEGGGLGLAWVKSIAEDFHGASIRAVNHTEGGAVLSILFPKEWSNPSAAPVQES